MDDHFIAKLNSRHSGKSAYEKLLRSKFIKANPNTTIFYFSNEGMRIEKPVKGALLPCKQLEKKD